MRHLKKSHETDAGEIKEQDVPFTRDSSVRMTSKISMRFVLEDLHRGVIILDLNFRLGMKTKKKKSRRQLFQMDSMLHKSANIRTEMDLGSQTF